LHLVDSHCHLDFTNFEQDFDAVLARAAEAGVTKIINPGVDLATSRKAVALTESVSPRVNLFAAVGFHPSEAEKLSADNFAALEQLAQNSKVVAVGEIGLDFFKNQKSAKVQTEAFERQLALAQKLNKPVIIHAREADAEIFSTLDQFKNLRGVFHCFGSDWDFAEQVLARGFFIGLTGIVTFANAVNVQEVARKTPLEKLLIETDAPFLAPQKFRGERCEPAFVVEVAQKIAELKNLPFAEIAAKTTQNAEELFGV